MPWLGALGRCVPLEFDDERRIRGVALGKVHDVGSAGTCQQFLEPQVVVGIREVRELYGGAQLLSGVVVVEGRPLRVYALDLFGDGRLVGGVLGDSEVIKD